MFIEHGPSPEDTGLKQVKKESAINKVVGGSPESLASVNELLKQNFNTRYKIGEHGEVLETEKSPELIKAIQAIDRYLSVFLRDYDVKSLDLRPDQVHFIAPDELPDNIRHNLWGEQLDKMIKECGGLYDSLDQRVFIFMKDGTDRKIDIAKTIAHESIHFNSFQSLNLREGESGLPNVSIRRLGLATMSGSFRHFNILNEAVTEELALRFARKYFPEMSYTEAEARKELEQNEFFNFDNGSYITARERLNWMIDNIFHANQDQFSDREEVFKIFVNAALQGKLLPLARIYEKTYGRGSFEELADEMEELFSKS